MNEQDIERWYAIRVTYSREERLKLYLDSLGVECFIAMCRKQESQEDGAVCRRIVPAVRNLIFIKSSRRVLNEIKLQVESKTPMRYIVNHSGEVITVAQHDMEQFIRVCNTQLDDLVYLTDLGSRLKVKDRVRVISGIFKGIEGEVVKVKKNLRVMVKIEGVVAVATPHIGAESLERL